MHPALEGETLPTWWRSLKSTPQLVDWFLVPALLAGFFLLADRRLAILFGTVVALSSTLVAARFQALSLLPLLGTAALAGALALSLDGLVRRRWSRPAKLLAWSLCLGTLAFQFAATVDLARARSYVDAWREDALAKIQSTADEVAHGGVDTEVFVLAPRAEVAGFAAFGPDLARALAPPFAHSTVHATVVADESNLASALEARREDPRFERRALLVLGSANNDMDLARLMTPGADETLGPEQQRAAINSQTTDEQDPNDVPSSSILKDAPGAPTKTGSKPNSPRPPTAPTRLDPLVTLRPLRPGWIGAGLLSAERAAPNGQGRWVFSSGVPAHAIGALSLDLPAAGLRGRVTLEFGASATAAHRKLWFDLDLPPGLAGAPPQRVELPLPQTVEWLLGPPLLGVTFFATGTPSETPTGEAHAPESTVLAFDLAPRVLAHATRPSLLEPAPNTLFDLSRTAAAPALHAYLDPSLPRPGRFTLELNLEMEDGQLELSATGPVPPGASGELRLVPQTLGPRDPALASARRPWTGYLATGLSQSLERAGAEGTLTLWLTFQGPGDLDLGRTPPQVGRFQATLP